MPLSEARLKILIKSITNQISKRDQDYFKNDNHRQLLATKFGAERVFLDPQRYKFVLIDPRSGEYSCNYCFLAVIKAMWNLNRNNTKLPSSYYRNMLKKGKDLFKSLGCRDKLTVKLPDNFDFNDLT